MLELLWIALLNSEVTTAPSPALRQQLEKVSALRIAELAERAAETEVRKLQHKLQAAQLLAQIREVEQPGSAHADAGENPLHGIQLLSVIDSGQQVSVWFREGERAFSLQPSQPSSHGLQMELRARQVILRKGNWQQVFHLAEGW
ncbi:hypothetical protein [Pseudidiomarina insulisalsae]|uniref:Uncharacterized protein n=1 Tax=Pseudidiomarina insulisalsae TaxID=575789 RepID=A0A432YLS2_9GAMM|nr:hypothetical protein [Pseudidiomarina insulisalsae]RUO61937.1 hypothetical protein CWI71_06170 [Pseudidiomarina insulisalsae]